MAQILDLQSFAAPGGVLPARSTTSNGCPKSSFSTTGCVIIVTPGS